jgi:hypothetical protein
MGTMVPVIERKHRIAMSDNFVQATKFNNYASESNAATVTSDSGFCSISYWIKTTSDGSNWWREASGHQIFGVNNGKLIFNFNPTGQLFTNTNNSYNDGRWHHALGSFDTNQTVGNKLAKVYVDDASDLTISFDSAAAGTNGYNGTTYQMCPTTSLVFEIAEFWFSNESLLVAGDIPLATRRKFISPMGTPVNLGANGERPTGTSPMFYLKGNAASWFTNRGAAGGGTFVSTSGTITDALSSPSIP